MVELIPVSSSSSNLFDAVIIIADGINSLSKLDNGDDGAKCPGIRVAIENYAKAFHCLDKGCVSLIHTDKLPIKRLIYASTGPVHADFDDVRRYTRAGTAAAEKALASGARSPLLVTIPSDRFPNAQLAAAIGFLHALYTPLQLRQEGGQDVKKADLLGILELPAGTARQGTKPAYPAGSLVKLLEAVQHSFDLCRDIGDGDPQRMSPAGVAEHVRRAFGSPESAVKVRIEEDIDRIRAGYPLLAAVSRCANAVEEHKARLIWLEYDGGGGGEPAETLFLVGKGVTLDTGGTDLKVGGAMHGMSRDKYGSAVVAGFFKALDELRPPGIKAFGCLCMCRNSIGTNAYTCDEIITSRSGKRVAVNNTDAEGRMAMADALSEFREKALAAKNAHVFTVATLTGHAILAYGHCAAAMDNGPARAGNYAEQLRNTADALGQPLEVSRLSHEDFDFHASDWEGAELKQATNKPSVQTMRGHQGPAAFLIRASRLDECGLDSGHPLKYTHLDIGFSMGAYPKSSLPSPLLALVAHHILPKIKLG